MRSSTGLERIAVCALNDAASKLAWLNPRSRCRVGCKGTGTMMSNWLPDRKSTRLNSSHLVISYAVFCLTKNTSIMENTNLSKQQQVSEIMRQMLTQPQTAGQYFTNDQIKEMTRKVRAEVDLVHQQTQYQRYGSSHIGATAKDISNVVTDAAAGVVDIFHGIYKAVADTWNNFWKHCKSAGIGSNLSRK